MFSTAANNKCHENSSDELVKWTETTSEQKDDDWLSHDKVELLLNDNI